MEYEEFTTMVLDNGSDTIKAGYSGSGNPWAIFPAIVGRHGCSIGGCVLLPCVPMQL